MSKTVIPAYAAPIFSDAIAACLSKNLDTASGAGVVAVGDTLVRHTDFAQWERHPTTWTITIDTRARTVAPSNLYGAEPRIAEAYGAPYLSTFGHPPFVRCVRSHFDAMAAVDDKMRKDRLVLCLSFGALIVSPDLPLGITERDTIDMHARLVIDARYAASAHGTVASLRAAEAFLEDIQMRNAGMSVPLKCDTPQPCPFLG